MIGRRVIRAAYSEGGRRRTRRFRMGFRAATSGRSNGLAALVRIGPAKLIPDVAPDARRLDTVRGPGLTNRKRPSAIPQRDHFTSSRAFPQLKSTASGHVRR